MAKVNLITRIEPELKKAFKELASSRCPPVTMSSYVEWLIQQEVDRHQKERNKDGKVKR